MVTSKPDKNIFRGVGVSPGICFGQVRKLGRSKIVVKLEYLSSDKIDGEIIRLELAAKRAEEQLEKLKQTIDPDEAGKHYYIIEAHQMMLQDASLIDGAAELIGNHSVNAEWAVKTTFERLADDFKKIPDEVFRRRAGDVIEVGHRLLEQLIGFEHTEIGWLPKDAVVVAHAITPADATEFYHRPISGLVMEVGGKTSHIAIIARSMEIPAVLGCEGVLDNVEDGHRIIIDGTEGVVIVDPSDDQEAFWQAKAEHYAEQQARLLLYKDEPAVTSDGQHIVLKGNIESVDEIPALGQHGAEGIGLFRTEFIYLDRTTAPSEEEHYEIYKRLAEDCTCGPVTLRTVDIGADKLPSYWVQQEDTNPALGVRAVRTVHDNPQYFTDQVRGILRASVHGELKLLLPFVSGVAELDDLIKRIEAIKDDLRREGLPFNENIPLGIMIELPSAVIVADQLAKRVAYFSIGTNDLIQYSLGVDRDTKTLAYLYNPLHPAILRMIRATCDAAKVAGIRVALCGEMASEPIFTLLLLGLGLTELDMPPAAIPYVKEIIRSSSLEEAQKIASDALNCETSVEVEALVYHEMQTRFPEFFRSQD